MLEIRDGYVYFETDKTVENKKKISGHTFVSLCGVDDFNPRGNAVLNLLGIYKEEVDKKYLYRGEFAEAIVRQYCKKVLKRPFVYYDEEAKKINNYDFFPSYKTWGGIPDIEFCDYAEIIEVKSKNISKRDDIIVKGNVPKQELYQCLLYAVLRKDTKGTMAYVFFDDETEKELFENKKPTSLKNIKLDFLSYNVKDYREDVKQKMIEAKNFYEKCIIEKRIPLKDLSQSIVVKIQTGELV